MLMAMPVIEQISRRVYGKGVTLSLSTTAIPLINFTTGEPADRTALGTWLDNFTLVAGVEDIDGPTMDRDDVILNELDNIPTSLTGSENLETFFAQQHQAGTKNLDALNIMLKMNAQQYQVLYMTYLTNAIYGWSINFPSGAALVGIGFTQSIETTFDPDKIIEVNWELQPCTGFQYLTICETRTAYHGQWLNYFQGLACPA